MADHSTPQSDQKWAFWVDRGGTFTDIVSRSPEGKYSASKFLSENPEQYQDAAIYGIKSILAEHGVTELNAHTVSAIKMGTTVATNALLEHKGEPVAAVVTKGFKDALWIGGQHRAPEQLFSLKLERPAPLYQRVIEIDARMNAGGEVVQPLEQRDARKALQAIFDSGIKAIAISLMHGYLNPQHEQTLKAIAQEIGFSQISVSHEVGAVIKYIGRSATTVVDAYLTPVLKHYVNQVAEHIHDIPLFFMQSHGGSTHADQFEGKDSILSGPAGGVVGMAKTSQQSGFDHVIGFDMGGTSTDVALFNGQYSRTLHTEIAQVPLYVPMLDIHTVAAGGGSILSIENGRLQVGPESAGAFPGPASYQHGGPLAVTDANVLLGKLQPDLFPHVFGPNGDAPLNKTAVVDKFKTLQTELNQDKSIEDIAQGFLTIAVQHMANAIGKISIQRGHDTSRFALNCFGGAGAQHACLVAKEIGINTILIHPYAGVLSALGMGLSDINHISQHSIEKPLSAALCVDLDTQAIEVFNEQAKTLHATYPAESFPIAKFQLALRYQGSDTEITVAYKGDNDRAVASQFETLHKEQFGFIRQDKPIIVASLIVEAVIEQHIPLSMRSQPSHAEYALIDTRDVYFEDRYWPTPFYKRELLTNAQAIQGPAILIEANSTTVIEPNWQCRLLHDGTLKLDYVENTLKESKTSKTEISKPDPILLEIFNHQFMNIAEQMGVVLANTAHSVNIKERLDFSCAIFNQTGELIANAPHVPVHLGSMGDSVQAVIARFKDSMVQGDAFIVNSPYHGGTHLPDITVISPVFIADELSFFVASRGHHTDIGGISPGSMPANSEYIEQEGILIEPLHCVNAGDFLEAHILSLFSNHTHPARNIDQNIADLQAQIAANQTGIDGLLNLVMQYTQNNVQGITVVQQYMQFIQDNAETSIREAIKQLDSGNTTLRLDNGLVIQLAVTIDPALGEATIDFTGSSPQSHINFNAPFAVVRAAVLYVFRTLINKPIPLNHGCLKPIHIIVPENCFLNPHYPAPVVAGNVETSQWITDALLQALGKQAGSQGTMNNFTFGTQDFQYYETICGGSGAGIDLTGQQFKGCDATQTHMTNSRLTDPEILEQRYPVQVNRFEIRKGSGGDGLYKGGDGITRHIKFLTPMTASILSSHRSQPPKGLGKGHEGDVGKTIHQASNGTEHTLQATDTVQVEAGDALIIHTPGGGGYTPE